MEAYSSTKIGRTLVIKLEEGEDVLESILMLCKQEKIKNAMVASGIGTFDCAHVHRITTTDYPPKQITDIINNTPLELASLSGFIANGNAHIHCVFGAPGGCTWAGHLEAGCQTLFFCEIILQELLEINLTRRPNEKGAPQLYPFE